MHLPDKLPDEMVTCTIGFHVGKWGTRCDDVKKSREQEKREAKGANQFNQNCTISDRSYRTRTAEGECSATKRTKGRMNGNERAGISQGPVPRWLVVAWAYNAYRVCGAFFS